MATSGDYAFVADDTCGLRVIDVSDPANPQPAGSLDTPGSAFGVALDGDYAVIPDAYSVRVADISDPTQPREVGFYDEPGHADGAVMAGSVILLADGSAGLQIYERITSAVSDGKATVGFTEARLLGNPVRNSELRLRLAARQAGVARISLYDVTGREADCFPMQAVRPEARDVKLPLDGVPAGVYLLTVRRSGSVSRFRVVVAE